VTFVPNLQGELEGHLARLEQEARAVRRALKALKGSGVRERGEAAIPSSVLSALVAGPGTRASVVALQLGRSVEGVRGELKRLEREGAVARDGLGWRLVSAAPARTATRSSF
jgi:hypothetical protein